MSSPPILSTQTVDVDTLDKKYLENEEAFEKKVDGMRARRDVTGDASMFSCMQPWIQPAIEDLLHQRIDYLADFQGELRWCQGEVIEVNKYETHPTKVTVCCDPMPDVDTYSKSIESKVTHLQTFWNKDKDRA